MITWGHAGPRAISAAPRRAPDAVTRPGGWRPVQPRGRSHRTLAQLAIPSTASGDGPVSGVVADDPVAAEAPEPEAGPATCIFCGRPSAQVVYAWPDWLCRFLAEHQDTWRTMRAARTTDLAMVERAEREADKTVDCVCGACSAGWMQRLEDNVRPFLESMIAGDVTPLPPVRRRLLARWAAKTAVVMECAYDAPIRTPRFACEYLRRIGVHPGTQVLVGRYEGDRQILTHERDLFSRMIDGKKHYLSQSSFVIGNAFIQVFADPWRSSAPELEQGAAQPLVALLPSHRNKIDWPPPLAIDDAGYDLVRSGGEDDDEDDDADASPASVGAQGDPAA